MASRALTTAAPVRIDAPAGRAPEVRLTAHDWRSFDTPAQTARWDALAQQAGEPNPFFESWYLLPSLRALDPSGRVQLLCLEANGELAGLLPLRRERDYYGYPLPHWRTWTHANCFLAAPLVARGCERLFWPALFAWADKRAGARLFLHLPELPRNGPSYEALGMALTRQGRQAVLVHQEERAMLSSGLSAEAYLDAALPGKKRKELRRQHRRLCEEGALVVERLHGDANLTRWIDEFLALERAGWKGKAGSALACNPATEALFRQALTGAAARDRLERLALRLDGRPLAMLATFLSPPGAFSYKTAFDEDFARFSPGVLLQRENLALLERDDIDWCDSCAAADHPMIDHLWRERRTVAGINVAIGGKPRRALFRALAALETRRRAGGPA
ncbi:GNAT family N-acetyltransferase [Altererythrobacter soli]|uniref:GNAT family N-acetyltransferase n=1 Tax=Croceibacterium soli TaxID=1739690 RepID=A0A6I4UX05_9SPHN|nr:GNAT family N-acetyltransferase [Croceibacterium soli]MXP41515.1 GNAT family N-acetyltransferase [Croceibacterium soli]